MAKQENNFDQIYRDLQLKKWAPVYFLMGEEPYYIDQISDYIQNNALNEDQREFDQTVLYGIDTDVSQIIHIARRYPMISPFQVVIVKEAQHLEKIEKLELYLKNLPKTTVLVICWKYATVDARKKWVNELKKVGVVFESAKLREYEIHAWINTFAKSKGLDLEKKSIQMLADFLGTDLSKIANELNKLLITNPKGTGSITPDCIEKNIGISKDFNTFELQEAIINQDAVKAYRIVQYFAENKKNHPIQMIIAQLFSFFSNLMIYHYLPQKSAEAASAEFKIPPMVAKNYVRAAQKINAWKTMKIIGWIRETDARSKGIDNIGADPADLYKELIYKILH